MSPNKLWLGLAGAGWLLGLAGGAWVIWSYSTTPGAIGVSTDRWPSSSKIPRELDRRTLLMFAHPRCACTRASLVELQEVMNDAPAALSAFVVLVRPEGTEEGWERSELWTAAERIEGVSIYVDARGEESTRFGALTSGHTVLYDEEGRLLYSGGITASRGHQGDNAGRRRLLALLADRPADSNAGIVFGCPLLGGTP